MATTTTNLGLTKPAYTDDADVMDINGNMDVIDAAVGALPTGKTLQGQITELAGGKLEYVQLTSVSGNDSKTYKMANDTKAIFVAFGATQGTKGIWIVNLAGTGVTYLDVAGSTNLTMSATNLKVTITNSASNGARVYAIVFAGSVEDDT